MKNLQSLIHQHYATIHWLRPFSPKTVVKKEGKEMEMSRVTDGAVQGGMRTSRSKALLLSAGIRRTARLPLVDP